jgi:hypothetical protein
MIMDLQTNEFVDHSIDPDKLLDKIHDEPLRYAVLSPSGEGIRMEKWHEYLSRLATEGAI